MFVCVFAKKFPALASQSCCEVSRPRAVGEYEYHLFFAAFHGLVARKTFSVDIPLVRVYPRFKLIRLDRKRLSSLFFVGQLGFWPRIRHYKSDKGKKNSQSRRCKMLYTTGSRVNIGLRLTFWRHKWKRWPISEQANNFQDGGMLFAFLTPL